MRRRLGTSAQGINGPDHLPLRLSFLERSAGLDATPCRCQVFDGELDGAHVIAVDVGDGAGISRGCKVTPVGRGRRLGGSFIDVSEPRDCFQEGILCPGGHFPPPESSL